MRVRGSRSARNRFGFVPFSAGEVGTSERANKETRWGTLAPRIGVAWDVTGDGRTSVRGGWGIYYATNSSQNLIVTVTNPPQTPRSP